MTLNHPQIFSIDLKNDPITSGGLQESWDLTKVVSVYPLHH